MKKKAVALFMIVGTGINSDLNDDGVRLLAQKLYSTINKIYPDKVIFFASDTSRQTIPFIEELFNKDGDDFVQDKDYQIVPLEAIDDFNTCFEIFELKIRELENDITHEYQIIMDYTSGTKTMSAAMACCGMFYKRDLISVGGDRSGGEVSRGTETVNYQNIYKIYDRFALKRIKQYFNSYRYIEAVDILDGIISSIIDKESFVNLCNAYYRWDIMDFENASLYLNKVEVTLPEFIEIREKVKKNKKALSIILHSRAEHLKNSYILACLINNSLRKAEEYNYDDAIARLYRSLELIAQTRLSKYKIKSSDVDISILSDKNVSEEFIAELKKIEENGTIKIGLTMDYLLLNELGDQLGKYYVQNESKIKGLIIKRNESILAHGLESQTKEDFDQFYEMVSELMYKLDKSMNRLLDETKFPMFDLYFMSSV